MLNTLINCLCNKYVIAQQWHDVHTLYVKPRIVCMSGESLQSFQQNKRATGNGLIAKLVLDQSSNVSTILRTVKGKIFKGCPENS